MSNATSVIEMSRNILSAELQLRNLVSSKINEILKTFDQWKSYEAAQNIEDIFLQGGIWQRCFRFAMIHAFSYPLLLQPEIMVLSELLKGLKVVDIGCGSGYLVSLLLRQGVDIIGVNEEKTAYPISVGCHINRQYLKLVNAIHWLDIYSRQMDCIILSWPPYDTSFGFDVLHSMHSGQILIYQGEGKKGCTGDDKMFDYLDTEFCLESSETAKLNDLHVRHFSINDGWGVYTKL